MERERVFELLRKALGELQDTAKNVTAEHREMGEALIDLTEEFFDNIARIEQHTAKCVDLMQDMKEIMAEIANEDA